MSGPESRKPDDRELESFLTGQSEVARAYRDALSVKAPNHLDAPVLKIARDELGRPQIVRAEPTRRGWRLPLAAAAVLVLSFSVLLNLQRDREARSMAFEMAPPAAAPAPPPVLAAATEAPQPMILEEKLDMSPQDVPAPSELSQARAMEYQVAKEAAKASAETVRAAPAAASPPPVQMQSAPLEARSEPESPPPDFAKRERKAMMLAPPAAGAVAAKKKPAAPAATRADAESDYLHKEEKKDATERPLPWLARIRALRDGGKLAEARQELAAFQNTYPDHVLPGDLQPLNSSSDGP